MKKLTTAFLLSIIAFSNILAGETISLFDGKTLTGWKVVDAKQQGWWSVKDGSITCGDGKSGLAKNTFLATEKEFGDFEFRCLFKITGDHKTGLINSGIQYRSVINNKISGYQADIGKNYWGGIYDENRRNKGLIKRDVSSLKYVLNPEGWNTYIIRCIGNRHQIYINGTLTGEYIEKDETIPAKGVIAFQLHSGGHAQVFFKHITITEL